MRKGLMGLLLTGLVLAGATAPALAETGETAKNITLRDDVSEELRLWVDARA